jgi:hypothetical protein
VTWSRRQLSEQVDALAADHEGGEFVEATERLALELSEEERELLGEVLLERADERGGFDYGLIRRVDERRWRLFGLPRKEPGRDGGKPTR